MGCMHAFKLELFVFAFDQGLHQAHEANFASQFKQFRQAIDVSTFAEKVELLGQLAALIYQDNDKIMCLRKILLLVVPRQGQPKSFLANVPSQLDVQSTQCQTFVRIIFVDGKLEHDDVSDVGTPTLKVLQDPLPVWFIQACCHHEYVGQGKLNEAPEH